MSIEPIQTKITFTNGVTFELARRPQGLVVLVSGGPFGSNVATIETDAADAQKLANLLIAGVRLTQIVS